MQSESIKQIAISLRGFQSEVKPIKRDANNSFYKSKYAPLDKVWEGIRETLEKHGLSVAQSLDNEDGHPVLETILMHDSGEWISGRYPVKGIKEDPQAYGSAITYARRYALSSILGIVTDDDDDGNSTTKTNQRSGQEDEKQKPPETQPTIKDPSAPATQPQIKAINTILGKMGINDDLARHQTVAELLELPEVPTSFTKLTKEQASKVIEKLGKEV